MLHGEKIKYMFIYFSLLSWPAGVYPNMSLLVFQPSWKYITSHGDSQNLKRHYLKSLPRRRLSMLGTNPRPCHATETAKLCAQPTFFSSLDWRISSGLQIARYFLLAEILKLIKRKPVFFCWQRLLASAGLIVGTCVARKKGQGRVT